MLYKKAVSRNYWIILPFAILILLFFLAAYASEQPIFDLGKFKTNYGIESLSFVSVGETPLPPLVILDFLFGKIPGYLVNQTDSNIGAAIITIAIWLVFFLVFGDIMYMFSGFSKTVNWTVAALLAVIGANLKIISYITVFFLSGLAVFGSLSVLAAIGSIFLLFIAFHFGSSGIRNWIILRRAEDQAMRAVAGGKKAAAGVEVLKDIASRAERGE